MTGTEKSEDRFVAALGFRALTPVYDAAVRLMGAEDRWRAAFTRQVAPTAGERILEMGCGTGSLTQRLAEAAPDARIFGLDPDPATLARARHKVAALPAAPHFIEGFADHPPAHPELVPGSFDKIATSLMFHHLTREGKRGAMASAMTLLKPGGMLHIADWAEARDWPQRIRFLTIQLLDGFETTADSIHGLLPFLIREAGFENIEETAYARTRYGPFGFWTAQHPR
ncbi:class I SAM-dependent methyltransferase [Parvibaculum sp.]|uniref:class I SAM-dependent methyltransferase n=1 Tax=Parvibaculum sp. TaxID=2024848 RepID=UPI0034A01072